MSLRIQMNSQMRSYACPEGSVSVGLQPRTLQAWGSAPNPEALRGLAFRDVWKRDFIL